ncbi:MAG: amino acid permease [Proteobacteria bacterium]|nr:amino acid permease [Pseudomonadota bacterium]
MAANSNQSTRTVKENAGGYNFGVFGGVFLPNILAILGVILYLRSGWVVGKAGIGYAVLIVLLAHFVTITTGLAISALSTNMTVRTGGAYYIISRSLGIEIGGCIGIPLAVSQILSIPFYIVGFVESLSPLIPSVPPVFIGLATLVILSLISLKGADLAIKAQFVVFLVIVFSLASLFLGRPIEGSGMPVIWGSFKGENFWSVFAVFFPAVTGIMSGVSMSGDLKDPKKSIPLGTMLSVLIGMVIYLVVIVFLGYYASESQLTGDSGVVLKVARWPQLIYAGIWAATLSSALGFLLAAPRTTQAIAKDGVLPRFLSRESGPKGEPRTALMVGIVLSSLVLTVGSLNIIASVLSMFFLATYGMLNLVAGLETLVGNPSYRPTIKVPWWVSLLGALSCFTVMFLIDAAATLVAIAIVAVIYVVMKKRNLDAAWGDLRRGIWMAAIRRSLFQMEQYTEQPKNWRPNIMVLTEIPQGRMELVRFAHWFGQRNGVVTLRHIIVGPFDKVGRRVKMAKNNLDAFIEENDLKAFGAVDVIGDPENDLRLVLSSQGYGGFTANSVLVDWEERSKNGGADFPGIVRGIEQAEKNLLLLKLDRDRGFSDRSAVDVWSRGRENASMMLILAELLTRNPDWRHALIRFSLVIEDESDRETAIAEARRMLDAGRLRCDVRTVVDGGDIIGKISTDSAEASLVICGLDLVDTPGNDVFEAIDRLIAYLPTTLIVRAGKDGPDLLA